MTRAKVSEVWDAVVDAGALSPDWAGLPGTDAGTHAQVLERLRSAGPGRLGVDRGPGRVLQQPGPAGRALAHRRPHQR